MKRTLVVVAAVVGFATAASAATLTVFTTNAANVATNSFLPGETILLKVTGTYSPGDTNPGGAQGTLLYDAAITTTLSARRAIGTWTRAA